MNARCPRCEGGPALGSLHREDDETVGLCAGCKGLYVSGPYIRTELGGRDPGEVLVPLERPHHQTLSCPGCATPMTALATRAEPEVEIDRCGKCGGYWLDRAELPAVKQLLAGVRRVMKSGRSSDRAGLEAAMYDFPASFDVDANPGDMGEWLFVLLSGLPREIWVPPTRPPWWTYGFIAVCVGVLLWMMGSGQSAEVILSGAAVPAEIAEGRGLRNLVTATFIHGGILHLVGNMYFLWVFGDNVEDALGRVAFPLFFVAAGAAGGLAEVAVDPHSARGMVGASGAISGVLGAYIVMFPRARLQVGVLWNVLEIPAIFFAFVWFLVQLLFAYASIPGIAWWAHVGGLGAGVLVGVAYRLVVLPRLGAATA